MIVNKGALLSVGGRGNASVVRYDEATLTAMAADSSARRR